MLIVIAVVIVVHELRPGRNPSTGGRGLFDGAAAVVTLLGTVVAILIGALAGSYDAAQGTMRYLVMTGARRGQIYAARTIALVLAVWLALLPSLLLGCAAALVLSSRGGRSDRAQRRRRPRLVGGAPLCCLRPHQHGHRRGDALERGRDRDLARVLLGFTPLLLLIDRLSHTLGDLTLPNLIDRLTGGDTGAPIPVAAHRDRRLGRRLLGRGRLRVQRDEY